MRLPVTNRFKSDFIQRLSTSKSHICFRKSLHTQKMIHSRSFLIIETITKNLDFFGFLPHFQIEVFYP